MTLGPRESTVPCTRDASVSITGHATESYVMVELVRQIAPAYPHRRAGLERVSAVMTAAEFASWAAYMAPEHLALKHND